MFPHITGTGYKQMSYELTSVDSILQKTQHTLLSLNAASPSDASNTTDVSTVEAEVEVELLIDSSCLIVDKEIDSLSSRSSKFIVCLKSKSAVGRSCDKVLFLIYLSINRSFEV
ncbi:hypothetical protein TNCV_1183451 [Trichonephila clavipes]|nr:hypothetical protein TNCV_1183451 [Trichonephila clavipes]